MMHTFKVFQGQGLEVIEQMEINGERMRKVNAALCPSWPITSLISSRCSMLQVQPQVQPQRGPAPALSCEQTSPNDRTNQCPGSQTAKVIIKKIGAAKCGTRGAVVAR